MKNPMNCPFCHKELSTRFGEPGICVHCYRYIHPEWYRHSEGLYGKKAPTAYNKDDFKEKENPFGTYSEIDCPVCHKDFIVGPNESKSDVLLQHIKLRHKYFPNPKTAEYCPACLANHREKIGLKTSIYHKDENILRCPHCGSFWANSGNTKYLKYPSAISHNNPTSSKLYESFHGMQPKIKRQINFTNPTGTLIKIGHVTRIDYAPGENSQHKGINFYHKAGDVGDKEIGSNWILATNQQGTNFYLIKDDPKSEFPLFDKGGRGIIG
jgi:hypothetical protein